MFQLTRCQTSWGLQVHIYFLIFALKHRSLVLNSLEVYQCVCFEHIEEKSEHINRKLSFLQLYTYQNISIENCHFYSYILKSDYCIGVLS